MTRGLDVFGGFLDGGRLHLMGEIGTEFERDWIYPLGTAELAGRTMPVPARPERLLEAMYGPGWRTPDPAFKFTTPDRTIRRLRRLVPRHPDRGPLLVPPGQRRCPQAVARHADRAGEDGSSAGPRR